MLEGFLAIANAGKQCLFNYEGQFHLKKAAAWDFSQLVSTAGRGGPVSGLSPRSIALASSLIFPGGGWLDQLDDFLIGTTVV